MEKKELQELVKWHTTYQSYGQHTRSSLEKRIQAQLRIVLGVRRQTQAKPLEKQISKSLQTSWNIGWLRIPSWYESGLPFLDWICEQSLTRMLVLEAQEKNEQAVGELRRRYQKNLHFYIREHAFAPDRFTHFEEHVQRMVEEVFYRAWSYLPKYNPYESSFYSWLLMIARSIMRRPPTKKEQMVAQSADEETFDDPDGEDWMDRHLPEDTIPPDQAMAISEMGGWLLKTLCREGGYPWQILVTLASKLDHSPQYIEQKMSAQTLDEMCTTVQKSYFQVSMRTKEELEDFFSPLKSALDKTVESLLSPTDNASKRNLGAFLERRAGDLQLRVFFGKHPNKNISEWHARTMVRLTKSIDIEGES